MVIPYLNKVLLCLSEPHWIQDHDVPVHQPFSGQFNEGAVRRAANVLMAIEQGADRDVVVNHAAHRLIKQAAKKGLLYSKELREDLLSTVIVKERMQVRVLEKIARDIFGKDLRMVAALTRELIHDRLLLIGDFTPGLVSGEFDAYYDVTYRGKFPVCSGVPLIGISRTNYTAATGHCGMHEMKLRVITPEGISSKDIKLWCPVSEPRSTDTPSTFIQSEKGTEVIIENISWGTQPPPGYLDFLGDVSVGQYCRLKEDDETEARRESSQAFPNFIIQRQNNSFNLI